MNSPTIPRSTHKISIKTLRLARPTPAINDIKDGNPYPSTLLALPQYFGAVYVGEQFTCILSANNPNDIGYEVKLSAVIQLPSKQITNTPDVPVLEEVSSVINAHDTIQKLVEFEPTEAGIHTLTIKSTYKPTNDEGALPITFLKHYQFTAKPGLNIKTKVAELSASEYTIEAQVENISEWPMTISELKLLAAEGWESQAFPKDDKSLLLLPRDVYQTAYILSRKADVNSQAVGFSRLSVSWRREAGEQGFMTTGPLKPPV